MHADDFRQSTASSTLLGKMASVLISPTSDWVSEASILDGTAVLPERGTPRLAVAPVRVALPTVVDDRASDWCDEWNVGGQKPDRKSGKIMLGEDWGSGCDLGATEAMPTTFTDSDEVDERGLREGIDAGWF